MMIPMTPNEHTFYQRACDHCREVLEEAGQVCEKCKFTIHERCKDVPCKLVAI